MSLSRKEQLEFCNKCAKKVFDRKKGIVCNLTYEHATFTKTCPDFEEDPIAVKRTERVEKNYEEMAERQMSGERGSGMPEPKGSSSKPESKGAFTSEKKMLNSGAGGGILMIIGGVAWLVIGWSAGYIFFYPFFLIIGGVVVMVKAAAQKAKEIQKTDTSGILDDHDELDDL